MNVKTGRRKGDSNEGEKGENTAAIDDDENNNFDYGATYLVPVLVARKITKHE